MLLLGLLQLPGPILTMRVIDAVNSHKTDSSINLICAALILIFLLTLLTRVVQRYALEKFKYRVIFSVQRSLFSHCLKLPLAYHIKHSHGYLMSRVNEDPYHIQAIMADSILSIIGDFITLVVGICFLFYLHWRLALISVSILPVLVVLFTHLRTALKEDFKKSQEKSALVNLYLGDSLSNIFTIKVFTLEKRMKRTYVKVISDLIRQRFRILRKKLTYESIIGILTGLVPIFILWYGSFEIAHGRLSVGEFIAFNGFLIYLYRPAEGIVISLLSMQGSVSAIERVFEIIDTNPELYQSDINWNGTQRSLHNERSDPPLIEFRSVSFHYPDKGEWVLDNVSFTINQDQFVAIVGPSGVGKTTLVNLIPRLIEPVRGEILIGGVDHRQINLVGLRKMATVVSQETRLFSTSILENILCGNPQASFEQVIEATRLACAHEFILQLPEGYHTQLGETGLNLSAGQRQRILIARAILRNPAIMILDEATAFLDMEIERELLQNLQRFLRKRILIIVSHRHSLMDFADRIFSLRAGKITELKPDELLNGKLSYDEVVAQDVYV